MPLQSTLSQLPSAETVADNTLLSPLVTGPLLLLAQRNPDLLSRLPWPPERFHLWLSPSRLSSVFPFDRLPQSISLPGVMPPLKALKALFTLGVILWANRALNRLALNYWHVKKQGEPWNFQGEGVETIWITGACSGFGREMVKLFAERTKANIVVLDVQDLPADMQHIPRVRYHQLDLSSSTSITTTVPALLEQWPPSVLINNAGIAAAHTILATDDAYLARLFQVNVLSHFTLLRLVLPGMLARRKGHVVSLASMASYTGTASLADYCASKAAVLGLHESLVQELAHRYEARGGHSLQASIVHPFWARTPLVGSWARELRDANAPVLEPRQVAEPIVDHVLRGRSGSVFVPRKMHQGVWLRVLPDWIALHLRGGLEAATRTKE